MTVIDDSRHAGHDGQGMVVGGDSTMWCGASCCCKLQIWNIKGAALYTYPFPTPKYIYFSSYYQVCTASLLLVSSIRLRVQYNTSI